MFLIMLQPSSCRTRTVSSTSTSPPPSSSSNLKKDHASQTSKPRGFSRVVGGFAHGHARKPTQLRRGAQGLKVFPHLRDFAWVKHQETKENLRKT